MMVTAVLISIIGGAGRSKKKEKKFNILTKST